jgi:hypothetical protein
MRLHYGRTVPVGYRGDKRCLRWALAAMTGRSPTVNATAEILCGIADHMTAGVTQTQYNRGRILRGTLTRLIA